MKPRASSPPHEAGAFRVVAAALPRKRGTEKRSAPHATAVRLRGERRVRLQLPNLSWPQRAETLWRNFGGLQGLGEGGERGIKRLVGQLEGAVMVAERKLGAAIDQGLHRLGRVHVLVAHEPTRLVGPDRQDGQSQRSVALTCAAEVPAVAVA